MNRKHFGVVALGVLVGSAVPACESSPAETSEETSTATQPWARAHFQEVTPTAPEGTLGGGFHQEVAVGHSTILQSNTGQVAFFNKSDGAPLDAKVGKGPFLDAGTLFQSFFPASSPNFINNFLPNPQAPSPSLPIWSTCDTTQDAWPNGAGSQAFIKSCLGNSAYDTHSDYDPVNRRFIIATHLRNTNWAYGTHVTDPTGTISYTNPGALADPANCPDPLPMGAVPSSYPASCKISDPFSWRITVFAVSVSENPADGFWLYVAPEMYADWPRVGISGSYYVVTNHSMSSKWEYDRHQPVVALYNTADLANGIGSVAFVKPDGTKEVATYAPPPGTLRSYTYAPADLPTGWTSTDYEDVRAGFLVVPAHDQTNGVAYVMSRSAHGEIPRLLGFVPNANPAVKPTVISAAMPSAPASGIVSYANVDPTSATIRNGYLYSTYEGSGNIPHIDCQSISTIGTALTLTPRWGANAPAGSSLIQTGPLVEATADGSAVLAYSVMDTVKKTLGVRSVTFSPTGTSGPEAIWDYGPFDTSSASVDSRSMNRQSVDPAVPQAVWILGVKGRGGTDDVQITQQVVVNPPAAPSCSASYVCDGKGSATNKITCLTPVNQLTLLRWSTTGCVAGEPECWPPATTAVVHDPYTWFDYYVPPSGTTIWYEAYFQDTNGSWSLSPTLTSTVTSIDCSCWSTVVCQLPNGQQIYPTVNSPPNWCSSKGGHLVTKWNCRQ